MKRETSVAAYWKCHRFFNETLPGGSGFPFRLLRSANYCFWLGYLDQDQVNRITMQSYGAGHEGHFGEFGFNVEHGLFPWEEKAVDESFQGCKRVLVAAAGGGREVISLARKGYSVVGFESSPPLVDACRANIARAGLDAEVVSAPVSGVPDLGEKFDAGYIGRGFYHHIRGRSWRIAFLRAFSATLVRQAPVLLSDFHTREFRKADLQTLKLSETVRKVFRRPDPVELGDRMGDGFHHTFTREEVERELEEAGLDVVAYRVSPFGPASRLAHLIARSG